MYTHRHLGEHHHTAITSGAPHLMERDPVGRRGVGAIETFRRLDPGTILAAILVLGLVLRVFIAGVYLPLSGLGNDMGAFNAWAKGSFLEDPENRTVVPRPSSLSAVTSPP